MSDRNTRTGCSQWPSKILVVIVLNNGVFLCSDKYCSSECYALFTDLFVTSYINDLSFIIKLTCSSVPLARITQNNAT